MRNSLEFAAVVLVAVTVACGGGTNVTFPAVSPEDVEVIPQGQTPSQEFVRMKEITVTKEDTPTSDLLIAEARAQAAAMGADALLIESIRRDPHDKIALLS